MSPHKLRSGASGLVPVEVLQVSGALQTLCQQGPVHVSADRWVKSSGEEAYFVENEPGDSASALHSEAGTPTSKGQCTRLTLLWSDRSATNRRNRLAA
jgi:hypothetical protein